MAQALAFLNANLYTPNLLTNHVLLVQDDKILAIVDKDTYLNNYKNNHTQSCSSSNLSIKEIDCNGLNLSPGFIDLQLNGCGGANFNESQENLSHKTILTMHNTNIKHGCTSFLPTLITSPLNLRQKALECIASFQQKYPKLVANVPGIHIEGPHISLDKKGTHNPEFIKPMAQQDLELYLKNAKYIKILTLAPEVNDLELVKQLLDAGVNVSLGHSNASYEQAKSYFDAGVKTATHLFNAMTAISNGRTPGLVGAIYDSKQVSSGIITDGVHVAWPLVKLSLDIKQDNIFIVTDAVMPAGTNITEFKFANKTIYVKDNICFDENNIISGSAITFDKQLSKLKNNTDLSLERIVRLATLNPAKQINIDSYVGQLKPGYLANLTIFNDNFDIKQTYVNGELVYQA